MNLRSLLISLAVLAAALVSVSAAAAQDVPTVAVAGATVAGISVAGMDQATAEATVNAALDQLVVIRVDDRVFKVSNEQLVASYATAAAVAETIARATPGDKLVSTRYSKSRLDAAVASIVRMTSTSGRASEWKLGPRRPYLTASKAGHAPSATVIHRQLLSALQHPLLRAGQAVVPIEKIPVVATVDDLGVVVVVSRPERLLRVWAPVRGKAKVIRTWKVAVGSPSYPTPTGHFTIVDMQTDPTWTPPDSDWAKGEKPVPPGPNNPLGTRWMGLDRENIGIHGTPKTDSLGGFASHGCIRMFIPSAEKLFELVATGTAVIIF